MRTFQPTCPFFWVLGAAGEITVNVPRRDCAVPTMLVKVPGANHGGLAARPSQSTAKTAAILAWFERYRTNNGDVE